MKKRGKVVPLGTFREAENNPEAQCYCKAAAE